MQVDDLAAVIYCTGFKPRIGFLPPEVLHQMGYQEQELFMPLLLHLDVWG